MYIKRSLNLLQVFRFFVAQRICCGFLPTVKFLSEKNISGGGNGENWLAAHAKSRKLNFIHESFSPAIVRKSRNLENVEIYNLKQSAWKENCRKTCTADPFEKPRAPEIDSNLKSRIKWFSRLMVHH